MNTEAAYGAKKVASLYILSIALWILVSQVVMQKNLLPARLAGYIELFQWLSFLLMAGLLMLFLARRYDRIHRADTARLAAAASSDPLTGLPNNHHFTAAFSELLTLTLAAEGRLALLFVNLDRFKQITGMVGPSGGDELLREVARRLARRATERGALVARRGGDEFVLALAVKDRAGAKQLAEELLSCFHYPFIAAGNETFIGASIGISLAPDDGVEVEQLVRNTDLAMCAAKKAGTNQAACYTPAMNAEAATRHATENSLRRALDRNEFAVYYQPKIGVREKRMCGMEALVRWISPEKGLIPPDLFIPVAEETGLILPLGEWVLRTACAQNKIWQEAGYPRVRVAVNISPLQFAQPNLVEVISGILAETGLEAQYLELEVTETVMFQDYERTKTTLEELAALGIHVSIDDFGTGYSSFASLKNLPFNSLKIDKSFVRDVVTKKSDAAIATTIIAMATSLDIDVVAEGVETAEQFEFLKKNNCTQMQGYYFERPVPAEQFAAILKNPEQTIGAKFPLELGGDEAGLLARSTALAAGGASLLKRVRRLTTPNKP